MNVYCKPRGAGKTYDLITLHFIGKTNYLLVGSNREKDRIVKQFTLSKLDSERIIPWNEAREKLQANLGSTIIIDNVDQFLETHFRANVKVVSLTGLNSNSIKPNQFLDPEYVAKLRKIS